MPREENAASGGISPVRDSGTSLAYQSKNSFERNRSHNERDKEEPAPSEEHQTPLNTPKIAISSEDAGPVVECQSPPRLHAGSAGGMKAGTAPHRAKEGLASDSPAPSVDSLARFSRFLSLLVVSALEEQTPSTTERERMALAELVRARRVGPEKTIRTILLRVYGGGLRRLCACYHVCMMYHISYVLRLPSLRSKARSRDGPVSPSLPRPPPRPPPHQHPPPLPPISSRCPLHVSAPNGSDDGSDRAEFGFVGTGNEHGGSGRQNGDGEADESPQQASPPPSPTRVERLEASPVGSPGSPRPLRYWARRIHQFLLSIRELRAVPGRDTDSLEKCLSEIRRAAGIRGGRSPSSSPLRFRRELPESPEPSKGGLRSPSQDKGC